MAYGTRGEDGVSWEDDFGDEALSRILWLFFP
jgi:hypothetical protein